MSCASIPPRPSTGTEAPPHVPWLRLDQKGTIQELSQAACRALGWVSESPLGTSFFSLVHRRNLDRVMRDVAQMVDYRKPQARWLVRLQAGNGRWRWYRAHVQNALHGPDEAIRVRLNAL